MTKKEVD